MKPIKAEFEILAYPEKATFTLDLKDNFCLLRVQDDRGIRVIIELKEDQLDSLENCFYAMYMLIRNSKD